MDAELFKILKLDAFSIIGKEGSTKDPSFGVENLWNEAEQHIGEIMPLLRLSQYGPIYWGAMSDFSHSLAPWEDNYQKGLYLAGFEMRDGNAIPPQDWTKWYIPARTYFAIETGEDYSKSFQAGICLVRKKGYQLSGAPFDHGENGQMEIYYPVEAAS